MPSFACDVCGGKVVSSGKRDWFVCENCGSEYPVDWMRAKYHKGIEMTIDGIASIGNLLIRAQQYYEKGEYKKAKEYCEKVLDIDAKNSSAQEIICNVDVVEQNTILAEDIISRAYKLMEEGSYREAEEIVLDALNLYKDNEELNNIHDMILSRKETRIEGSCLLSYQGGKESFFIPDGIKAIEKYAFATKYTPNSRLKSVYIPMSVSEIGDYAFAGCENLEELHFSYPYNIRRIGNSAFEGCISLRGCLAFDGVIYLGEFAFYGCKRLRRIDLNNSVLGSEDGYVGACSLHTGGTTHISASALTSPMLERCLMSKEEYQKESKEREEKNQPAYRRSKGICQYCGGNFEGKIFKKCKRCGKRKDY